MAASPDSVKLLLRLGADVLIEKGAGDLSGFVDEYFQSHLLFIFLEQLINYQQKDC